MVTRGGSKVKDKKEGGELKLKTLFNEVHKAGQRKRERPNVKTNYCVRRLGQGSVKQRFGLDRDLRKCLACRHLVRLNVAGKSDTPLEKKG